jgi:HPt (histidine-containing phosphotransfer) domain-containing protein
MDRAIAAGCDDYLVKPAPREILWRILAGDPLIAPSRDTGGTTAIDAASPVLVDPDLFESLPAFLDSRRQMLGEIEPALARGDRAAVKRLAHKLAGGFSLYGFDWAAAECRAIERGAAHGEQEALALRAAAVRSHLERAEIRPLPAPDAKAAGG